jgi:2-oxoisovalerate dehydrogenase E1 component alpha subunit
MQAHTNADDDTRYRENSEVAEWRAKDSHSITVYVMAGRPLGS